MGDNQLLIEHVTTQPHAPSTVLRRDCSQVKRLCIDDKNFLRGSSFVIILSALDQGRVLEATPSLRSVHNREDQASLWMRLCLVACGTGWPGASP